MPPYVKLCGGYLDGYSLHVGLDAYEAGRLKLPIIRLSTGTGAIWDMAKRDEIRARTRWVVYLIFEGQWRYLRIERAERCRGK